MEGYRWCLTWGRPMPDNFYRDSPGREEQPGRRYGVAIMEVNIVPLGLGQPSIGDHIAQIASYLDEEHIPHELCDMGTMLEGEVPRLLQLAARLHELPFEKGSQRVQTTITIDDRRDKEVHLGDKPRSVRSRLGQG